jgi:FixJ family two-component response regulator
MNAAVPCVAVVDDEAPVRSALGRLLRLSNYDVTTFACGEAFLAALDELRPDCVVLDVHMPGLSGLDVQARLKAAHVDVPVVFITASDDLALDRQVRDAGGGELLHKPFSKDVLLSTVDAALHSRSRDAT